MALRDQFEKVGSKGIDFRGAPFWSWNDDLDPEELARQVREMAKAGLGGHFMHAGTGLITEYMSSEWVRYIKAAVAASKEAGIKAWLYDEENWPSGTAGGAIPALAAEYVAKRLCWEQIPPHSFKPHKRTIATFLVEPGGRPGPEIRRIEPKLAARKAKHNEELLHFCYAVPQFHSQTAPYADLLNPKTVREFIRRTYQAYRKAVGREFGKTVPGIFTDEPRWNGVPWSTALPKYFRKLNGYDLEPHLAALVYEVGDYRAFRYDFWRTATALFVESFTKQIGEWCRKRKIALTGHMSEEDNFCGQLRHVGAAMPHYEHMQVPGIDHLYRRIAEPLLCKQASSVAHQFGGRRVLSEMFGATGWNVSFEELKWIAESQFALGVDLVCPHLSLYSARGCRKRDYPPSLHYQQPWWDEYRLLNDYFARLTFMLTRGKHVADVLVLHTIESAWAGYRPDDTKQSEELNKGLVAVSKALLGMHYDFDFGDESILANHARVSKGTLRVSHSEYSVVIVPPCLTLRGTTLDILERFIERGGTVILAGPAPELEDGRASRRPAAVLKNAITAKLTPKAIKAALAKVLDFRIAVFDAKGRDAVNVYAQQRDVKLQQIYFLANVSPTDRARTIVRLPGRGRLERWDAETGQAEPLKTRKRGRFLETELTFEPMGSHLLVLSKRRRPVAVRTREPRVVKRLELAEAWSLERTEPNALTIDRCSYRLGHGEWSEPLPVLDVQDRLQRVAGSEVCEFKYSFAADFSAKLPHELHLAMEDPEAYEIFMNGVAVGAEEDEAEEERKDLGWWRDISFRRLDVLPFLKPQERNDIVLRRVITGEAGRKAAMEQSGATAAEKNRLRYGPEIESVYIIGEFLVRSLSPFEPDERRTVRADGDFVLIDNWGQATTGDLVEQGLPFYAGSARLSQTVVVPEKLLKPAKGAKLALDVPDAIVTKVHVNGQLVSTRAWRPYEFEIGELLVPGRNEIAIELTGSCRNLLGPHHHTDGEPYCVGPQSFRGGRDDARSAWTDRYTFVRFGLASPVTLTLWK